MLSITNLHAGYGKVEVLQGISLEVPKGQVVTLIGSNGAGKTTTLRSISGIVPPREGSIYYLGQEIAKIPPQDIVALGISQSPEGRRCFPRMTVREISLPSKRIEPLRGGVRPEIERSVVDLPAPLEPISVTHSPSSTVSETPFSAWMLP